MEEKKERKPKSIAADLDGWIAAHQNWKPGKNGIGESNIRNIAKMFEHKTKYPKDKIYVVLKMIDPTDNNIRPQMLSDRIGEIRDWLKANNVSHDELWTKPYEPEVNEWWTVKVREDE